MRTANPSVRTGTPGLSVRWPHASGFAYPPATLGALRQGLAKPHTCAPTSECLPTVGSSTAISSGKHVNFAWQTGTTSVTCKKRWFDLCQEAHRRSSVEVGWCQCQLYCGIQVHSALVKVLAGFSLICLRRFGCLSRTSPDDELCQNVVYDLRENGVADDQGNLTEHAGIVERPGLSSRCHHIPRGPAAIRKIEQVRRPIEAPMPRRLLLGRIDDQPVDGRARHYPASGGTSGSKRAIRTGRSSPAVSQTSRRSMSK